MFKMKELGKKFENYAENTMDAPVFISARNSEARLREAYNRPVPSSRTEHEAWSKQVIADLINEINARAQIMCEEGYLEKKMCSAKELSDFAITNEELEELEEERNDSSDEMEEDEAEQEEEEEEEEEEQEANDLHNAASSYGSTVSPNSLLRFVFGSQSTANNVNTRQNAVPYISPAQNYAPRSNLALPISSSSSNYNATDSQNENMLAITAPSVFLRSSRARSSLSNSSSTSSITLSPLLSNSANSNNLSNIWTPPPPPPSLLSTSRNSNDSNNSGSYPSRSQSAISNVRNNQTQVPLQSNSSNSTSASRAIPYAHALQNTSRFSNVTAPSSQSMSMSMSSQFSSSNASYPSALTVRRRNLNIRSTGSQPSSRATAKSASIAFYIVTDKSQDLVASYNDTRGDQQLAKEHSEVYVDLIQARRALDIWAALQELHSRKCHMQRYNMEKTGIVGYGLHEIIALLWHSIKEAQKAGTLYKGIDIDEALYSLIHGIANAARGKNRDTPGAIDNYDDLSPVSEAKCDQGCYNSLMHSMLGILPQVEIVYSYMERFSIFLQREVCKQIIDNTKDLDLARMYLNIWLGRSKDSSTGYENFVQSVKNDFPGMVKNFIQENANTNIEAKRLKQYLKNEIKKVDNIGIPCIETVAPTEKMLEALWNQRHRKSLKRQLSPN